METEPTGDIDLSIVIPAHNEAERLPETLKRIVAYITAAPQKIEIIVIDDGSSDQTAEVGRTFDRPNLSVRVLVNDPNRGKGYSVRRGMLAAHGRVVLMSDADLSTPIAEVDKLLPWLSKGFDVAIGSRDLPDSILDPPQPALRRLMGAVFRTIRRLIMLRGLRDTQCGFKCFTRAAANDVFEPMVAEGFAFDCEALGRADRLGYRIKEVAVVWSDDRRSSLRPVRDGLRMFLSLVRIRWRIRRVGKDPRSTPVDRE